MKTFSLNPINKPVTSTQFNVPKAVGQEVLGQAKLIVKAYGLSSVKTTFYAANQDFEKIAIEDEARQEGLKNRQFNDFGLPTFDIFTFAKTDWTTLDGEQKSIPEYNMGIALIEINQARNVIKTPIQGRNTTVKEFISNNDFEITVRGVISSYARDVYPAEAVERLRDFFAVEDSLVIGSDYLNRWGIHNIVITDFSLSQEEGNRSLQKFEFRALSDEPFEIKSKKS